ncbi:MAG: integrase family protein [Rickettsiales bacterium]|nr:integrase family protein [Rickettsiales bacterium]
MLIKLDEKTIRNLPYTESGQKYYFDTKQKGFGVYIGQKTKTFFIQRYRNNRLIRVKIGNHGDLNCTVARERAQEYAVQIQQGINPNELKREKSKQHSTSVHALYDRYAQSLLAQGKLSSYEEYPKVLGRHVADWMNKSAYAITREMVAVRHQEITKYKGPSVANRVMVILSGIYQHAISDKCDIENPVKVLTDRKLWNKAKQRKNYIKPKQFESWFSAVEDIPNQFMRLFIIFQLLNGLRKSEGLTLEWDNIDFINQTITIPKTKNGTTHTLPITSYNRAILEFLAKHRINRWVFPSDRSKSGHITEPKKAVNQIKMQTGLNITLHDLRRSFTAVANGLSISRYTIKRLLNHSLDNDVTAIYIPGDVEAFKEPLQEIQNQIIAHGNTDLSRFL